VQRKVFLDIAHTLDEYRAITASSRAERLQRLEYELGIVPSGATGGAFSVEGFCYPCKTLRDFRVSLDGHGWIDGRVYPAYREQLICDVCRCCNRQRSSVHLIHEHFRIKRNAAVYITEMITPAYRALKRDFDNLIGSEHLSDKVGRGQTDARGVRNENVTGLTFANDSLDAIWSFEVLEHVPDFERGLAEFHRCLKAGGTLFVTVPFLHENQETLVRARVVGGTIQHLQPAEYHGPDLCYYHFGWDFIDKLRGLGFRDAYGLALSSKDYAYLGQGMVVVCAIK
jgi:SAM-dependent methyltransferase